MGDSSISSAEIREISEFNSEISRLFLLTYDASMPRHLTALSELCPEAGKGRVVYSGETIPNIAVHFADVPAWCMCENESEPS